MAERLSFKRVASEALEQFNLENGLFRTFIDLVVRPGQMLHGHLNGSRQSQYVGVMTYLFLAVAISVSLDSFFDPSHDWHLDKIAELEKERNEVISGGIRPFMLDSVNESFSDRLEMYNGIYLVTQKYYQQITYLGIPIFALATTLFFRFWKFNLAEHLTINAFITAQESIYMICLNLLMYLFPPLRIESLAMSAIGLLIVYRTWVYMQVSKNYKINFRMESIPRSLFAIGLATIVSTTLILGAVAVLINADLLTP